MIEDVRKVEELYGVVRVLTAVASQGKNPCK